MNRKKSIGMGIVLIPLLAALACSVGGAESTQVPTDILYTNAAKTYAAEHTQGQTGVGDPTQPPPAGHTNTTIPQVSETIPPTFTPTLTLTPTTTQTLTPTVSVSPTTSTDDILLTLGNPDFVDNMDNDTNWFLYDDSHSKFWIEGGYMKLTAYNPDYYEAWAVSWPDLTNFYLEMTYISQDKCGLNDRYGMIAHAPDSGEGYLIAFTCDGRYSVRIWDGSDYTVLIDWTYSQQINAGTNQTNRIGLKANAKKLAVYANGIYLGEVKNGAYTHGRFGPLIGAVNTSNFTMWLDKVAYWVLP